MPVSKMTEEGKEKQTNKSGQLAKEQGNRKRSIEITTDTNDSNFLLSTHIFQFSFKIKFNSLLLIKDTLNDREIVKCKVPG